MTPSGIQPLAQFVAERALNSIAGGLLIAAFAWLVLRVVGRQNSGTRFAVWFSALIAIAVLPFVPAPGHAGGMVHAMHAEIMLPKFWAVTIFAVWIFFAALAATRIFTGLCKVRRLRGSGVAIETSTLHPAVGKMLDQCQAIRPVTVCTSPMVSVPTAIGFFKPAILIPEWALRELPVEELRIILLHEFTHLRRWDDWTNLAQKIVRTVFFFHPAVWWIEKRLSLEREMACDDVVLAETGNPRAYAECLVSLAEKSFVQRSLALAQAAISRACDTSIRLAQILDVERPQGARVFKPALGLMTVISAACLVMLPDAPKLIAFEQQPQSFATASENLPRGAEVAAIPVTVRTGISSKGKTEIGKVVATPAVYRPSKSAQVDFDGNFSQSLGAKQSRHRRPVLAVSAAAKQAIPVPGFLLVMQTTEFDEQGSAVFSVSVWRVIILQRQGKAVQPGVVAKVI
ncbi:MAG TPA: M56 family metallopeptidase [Candidatus Eremiobacteraceae bacterium]|nr:M56 family metallopeptidase [Candidatus Eremiobacteraceae bacterium]